jgi:hypothetical protein
MAEDKKQDEKPVKKQKYKVKKEFTLDELYKVGSYVELPNGKIKDTLTLNKFI